MRYDVQLEEFQGPMDVLLDLIKQNSLNIWDVNLSVVTDQYLNYIKTMEEINLNVSSDYLVIAAELMNIKSKKLLPNQTEAPEEEAELLHRLVEYKKYKEASEKLRLLNEERLKSFSKTPSDLSVYKDDTVKMSYIGVDELLDAFAQFLDRKKEQQPLTASIVRKEYSVAQRKTEIMQLLQENKQVKFAELFVEYNRPYIIVTFLTILEMAQKLLIEIVQDDRQQIFLSKKEGVK